MQVKVAKSAGFCFGVQRAVDTVYEQVEKGIRPIYTYGPIIHNEVVVQDLEEKGVRVLDSKEELEALTEGTVIIRSHGVGREIYDLIQEKGLICVDATCPVCERRSTGPWKKRVQRARQIIIIGNDKHPEVEGIKGWCRTPGNLVSGILRSRQRLWSLRKNSSVCIVSQTTFNYKKFQDLVEILDKKRYDRVVVNTICNATEERQTEARQIAGRGRRHDRDWRQPQFKYAEAI